MKKLFISYILVLAVCSFAVGQQVAKSENSTFALTNATIETVTNGVINGTLLIQNGKITGLGSNVTIPSGAKTIDCSGMTIYPGMIDGGTTLGLSEVGSISLTQDYDEIGDFTPHADALTAVNPNSVLIPVTRVNGVTTVLTVPKSGLFPGTASLINLHGYTPKQMYAGFRGIVMNFPSTGRRGRRDRRSDDDIKKQSEKALKKLNETWERCTQYASLKANQSDMHKYNPEMDAMIPVVKGEAPIMIEVNAKDDILSALKWVEEKNVNAIFTGVAEGWRVADSIAAANIPVITGPVLSTPRRSSDRYDSAYKNAGLMHQAGVKVAIRTNETENVRNLPFNAGFAAAYGMGKEEALKAVTIVPAEIFGVDDQLGSLEVGKVANVIVADGDPFETKTQFQHIFINGWKVPLESRHTLLYDEFLERSPGLRK
jgi:imidazolonepropionase-like amidohydrolase